MQDHLFTTGTGADLTPPQVVSTNPPSGATGVGTNVVLQATFDRPIDPLLVGGATVYLRTSSSGTPVSTVLNISQDSKSITLTLHNLSGYNQFVRVTRRTKRQREKANSPVVQVVQLESPLERLSDCRTVPYLRFFLVRNEEVVGSNPISSTKIQRSGPET